MLFTTEKGIIDIIYLYHIGIKYQVLQKIVRKNFANFNLDNNSLNELTKYLIEKITNGKFENNILNIRIFINRISTIIYGNCFFFYSSNNKNIYNQYSLYDIIIKLIKDIENSTSYKFNILFYG